MKKNLAFLISVPLFVWFFYDLDLGINIGLLGIILWILLLLTTKQKQKPKDFWMISTVVIATSLGFAWYGDFLSFVALAASMAIVLYKANYRKLNVLLLPIIVFYSGLSSTVRIWMGKTWKKNGTGSIPNLYKKTLYYIALPAIVLILFIWLYSNVSERFASYFTINFQFDMLRIVVLTIVGVAILFNFFYFSAHRIILKQNHRLKDSYTVEEKILNQNKLNTQHLQRRGGEIMLLLLNALLVFFIIIYATDGLSAPKESYSNDVHERIYTVIPSIIIAVIIIMVYFRRYHQYAKESKRLITLAYTWIFFNAALVIIAAHKNTEYVHQYGLTFKRIGVYIFLLLTIIGLLITSYKLMYKKTNAYLVNRMTWVAYGVLVISSLINWSNVVTKYNLSNTTKPDISYLQSLEYNKKAMYQLNKLGKNENDNEDLLQKIASEKQKPFFVKRLYYEFLNIE